MESPPILLTLPVELRELIYGFLFSTYTIRHGFQQPDDPPKPAHRTALLLTCRQVHAEAWRHLPLNCTLQFHGTENMLDTLLSVEQSVVTRLRYVHVRASFPFPLYTAGRHYYPTYYAANALTLLPGLCLDELVVEDCWHGYGLGDAPAPQHKTQHKLTPQGWRDVTTYFDIETLLCSAAWRTLTYITPSTEFLASGYDVRSKRLPQPETWDAMLKARTDDDPHADTDASVEMFIAPYKADVSLPPSPQPQDTTSTGTGTGTGTVTPSRPMYPWSAVPGNLVIADRSLAAPYQTLKGEVHIVARRSRGTHPVQKGLSEARTWREMKAEVGGFLRSDWVPYHNDMADAMGWVYGGWGRRMQLANEALGACDEAAP